MTITTHPSGLRRYGVVNCCLPDYRAAESKASPVQGEVGERSEAGGVDGRQYVLGLNRVVLLAVNPSVSLTADSSPYTGEPLVHHSTNTISPINNNLSG